MACIEIVMREGGESPLDDLDEVKSQMRQFAVIARCEFEQSSTTLINFFDPISVAFAQALVQGDTESPEFHILEGQLTWLVFMISAIVGGRRTTSPHEAYDTFDSELIVRVLKVCSLCKTKLQHTHLTVL
jgi:exportin-7